MTIQLEKLIQIHGDRKTQNNEWVATCTSFRMAREAGLEPATDGLENHCSIQLSYSRVKKNPFIELGTG